jgi:iron complex transport system substrate-binding protein
VRLDGPAQRIVSLVPSATQTLREIGASSRLVGRTDFDTDPWAEDLPSVGGGLEPNLEAIVALRPDLVIRFAGSQDQRTPERLDDLEIAHLALRPDKVDDILDAVRMLGAATRLEDEAAELVAEIRDGLARVESMVEDLPRRRVAYVLGGTPPWVAGPETYIDELMTLAGGDNAFSDLSDLYAAVSPEEIRSRAIEIVLVSGADAFDPSLAPDARIELVDAAIEIPGPNLVEAALRLAELIHGSLISPPSSPSPGVVDP